MSIDVVFNPPLPSDPPATFNTKAFATLGSLNTWSTEANALAGEVSADAVAASDFAGSASASAGNAAMSESSAGTSAIAAGDARDAAIAARNAAQAAQGLAEDAAEAAQTWDPGNYVPKAGGEYTGHIEVPAGASGAQVARAEEVLRLGVGGLVVGKTELRLSNLPVLEVTGGTQTFDLAALPRNFLLVPVAGNVTFTLDPGSPGDWLALWVARDSGTVTWAGVTWKTPGGVAPGLGTTGSLILFISDGTTSYGFPVGATQ